MRLPIAMPRFLWRASVSAIVLMGSMWIAGPVRAQEAQAQDKKPNILVIWGDDIGQSNISAYTMGLMGYRTPNIDRIAREGMIFTDYYGVPTDQERNSCRSYLERQIKLINPKIICVLGRTAHEALLKGGSIISKRGKLIQYENRFYFLTVHPAAVIYNPQLKSVFKKDIANLGDTLKKLESKRVSLEEYL